MKPKLILMRHGQSIWNKQNLFTGWVDIPLSVEGIAESIEGGKKIAHLPIHVIFTSTLIRSQMTVALAMLHHASGKIPIFQHEGKLGQWSHIFCEETKKNTIPVYAASELNERMYGELQGFNKAQTAEKYGKEQVQRWRRDYNEVPPKGESLAMTVARALPYFQKEIVPRLEKGENVLVVAHGNSLRGIAMFLDKLTEEEVVGLELATGAPFFYSYEKGIWKKET